MSNTVNYQYQGAKVLVVGGTSGIGAGIANAYLAAGATVTITGTRPSVHEYDADLKAFDYWPLSLEDNQQIDGLSNKINGLDILVNSGGVALLALGLDEYEPDNFARAIQMHLIGVYRMAKNLAPQLSQSQLPGGASIINIASMSSYFAIDMVPGYGAAKAGLVQLTKTLALHYAKHNIRANAVAAGLTASRMTSAVVENPDFLAFTLARTPLGRVAQPADIADPVLFLTSSAARYITGQTIPVDGGYTIVG